MVWDSSPAWGSSSSEEQPAESLESRPSRSTFPGSGDQCPTFGSGRARRSGGRQWSGMRPVPSDAPGGSGSVLTVREVAVRFGGVSALSEVSLSVQPGTVTGLIGPNGAGKTTLFNVISGLQAPGRGTVHIFDTDVTTMKPHRRARLGLARTFQRLELFGTLTAGENVQVGLESAVKWWEWRHLKRAVPFRRANGRTGPAPADAAEPSGPGSIAVATSDRLLEGVGLGGCG